MIFFLVQNLVVFHFEPHPIIHPNQIEPINEAYKVSRQEYEMAKKMLDTDTQAIIVQDGQMGEKFAHSSWAKIILTRYHFYGLKEAN